MLLDTGLAVPVAVASSNVYTTVSAVFTLSDPAANAPLSICPSGTIDPSVAYVADNKFKVLVGNVLVTDCPIS